MSGFLRAFVLCLFMAVSSFTFAQNSSPEMAIELGDMTDTRSTKKSFWQLEIELKLSEELLKTAIKFAKPINTTPIYYKGFFIRHKDQKDKNDPFFTKSFKDVKEDIKVKLRTPSRQAATITLEGYVPVYIPSEDKTSIMVVDNISANYGISYDLDKEATTKIVVYDKQRALEKKLAEEKQTASKKNNEKAPKDLGEGMAELFSGMISSFGAMGDMGENDLMFVTTDSKQRIIGVQLADAAGKPVKSSGHGAWGTPEEYTYVYNYTSPIPQNAKLYVFVATPQSLINVPFAFKDVQLP